MEQEASATPAQSAGLSCFVPRVYQYLYVEQGNHPRSFYIQNFNMRRLKHLEQVQQLIRRAKLASLELSKELEEKQVYYDSKPNYWKKSERGQHWAKLLYDARKLIYDVENLQLIGRKYTLTKNDLVQAQERNLCR